MHMVERHEGALGHSHICEAQGKRIRALEGLVSGMHAGLALLGPRTWRAAGARCCSGRPLQCWRLLPPAGWLALRFGTSEVLVKGQGGALAAHRHLHGARLQGPGQARRAISGACSRRAGPLRCPRQRQAGAARRMHVQCGKQRTIALDMPVSVWCRLILTSAALRAGGEAGGFFGCGRQQRWAGCPPAASSAQPAAQLQCGHRLLLPPLTSPRALTWRRCPPARAGGWPSRRKRAGGPACPAGCPPRTAGTAGRGGQYGTVPQG